MLKDEILAFLDDQSYISGAWIASRLGVSRAAIAKAVKALRMDGYAIDAIPNRGYRLKQMPDLLHASAIQALLDAHPWRERIRVYAMLDSTNLELKREAVSGAPAGSVAIAEQQTAGRGRLGRSFLSRPGVGIYLSLLLRPQCAPSELLTLTAQAAVAVRRAIHTVCGVDADIKWVNDLLIGRKKICGILTELSVEAESGRVSYAVVGVGVNCNQAAEDFPPELQEIAGSIYSQTGVRVDRNRLAAEMIRQLSLLPQMDWRAEYRKACVTVGQEIVLLRGDTRQEATALDVGTQAELLVRYPDGTEGSVNSGEISVRGL